MRKYYFFKTVLDSGRLRLRPLSGQKFADNDSEVDVTMNVASDKKIRSEYPVGTVFVATSLERKAGFYATSLILPVVHEYKLEAHKPSQEAIDAYYEFAGGSIKVEATKPESKSKPRKKTLLSKLQNNEKLQPPTIQEDGFFVSEKDWYLLVRNIQQGINTMMIGATGSGKTELVMLACKKLGIECCVYDMGSMYDPMAGLLGVHRLQKGGESVFDYAKFTQDIQKPCVILLDELSRAPAMTNNILFPCLDSRRTLPVEIAGGEDLRSIPVHKDCCFIATANVGAEYTGTMSMDKALVNRFFPMELAYMNERDEATVLENREGIDEEDASIIAKVMHRIRTTYEKQEISSSVSTRESLMVASLVKDGWSKLDALSMVVLPMYEGTLTEGERSIVHKILISM